MEKGGGGPSSAVGLTAVSVVLISAGQVLGWVGLVFTPAIPVSLAQFVRPPFVRVGDRAISVRQAVGRTRTYDVERMGPIAVWSHGGTPRGVPFDYDHDGSTPRWAAFTRRRVGVSEHISDLYERDPAELAEIISSARDAIHGSQT